MNDATLEKVADHHANSLYDVVALLAAAADRIDAATPSTKVDEAAADAMHYTLRLVQMAGDKAQAIADRMLGV